MDQATELWRAMCSTADNSMTGVWKPVHLMRAAAKIGITDQGEAWRLSHVLFDRGLYRVGDHVHGMVRNED